MMSTQKEISIHYHPHDGAEWAKYLESRLGEQEYEIDIALKDVTTPDISRGRSRINLFLITPDFLDFIDLKIMKGFDHRYSLAILMGVDTETFTFITTQHGVHEDVKDWLMLDVEESEESVRHLLITIVTMYEYDYPPSRIRSVFREIIDEGMKVYIGLERKTKSDVSVQSDGNEEELKATYTNRYFYAFSLTDEEAHMLSTFSVLCNEHKIGEGQLKDVIPSPRPVNRRHGVLYAGHSSNAVHGNQSKLKQLWELLEDETDPIDLLCQSMGLGGSDKEQLDRKLANKISEQGFPEHLSLTDIDEHLFQTLRDEQWPTLLHFAAEYNLVGFAEALLSYPALVGACMIRNLDGRTPDEIAHNSGHQELSEMLRLFSIFILGPVEVVQDPNLGETDGRLDTAVDLELKQSTLNEERKEHRTIPCQPIDIRETFKHKEKKKGFFSKLLQKKDKHKKRYAPRCNLDTLCEFQRKNTDVSRKYTQHDVPAERGSGINRNKSVSSDSDKTENKLKKAMLRVHDDAKASSKKIRLFLRNAEI